MKTLGDPSGSSEAGVPFRGAWNEHAGWAFLAPNLYLGCHQAEGMCPSAEWNVWRGSQEDPFAANLLTAGECALGHEGEI